jgi:hypothetical protein
MTSPFANHTAVPRFAAVSSSNQKALTASWVQAMVGNRTTSQGTMKDCYFLAALDAAFDEPAATAYIMKAIQPVGPAQFWVNRSDGRRVWVDLAEQPDFPGRVKGPLAYQVLEAAYRDLPLHTLAPYPSYFASGGYSVDVWLALLGRMPGIRPMQSNGTNWDTSLANYGEAAAVEAVLYQAAMQAPPALMTATTLNPPKNQQVKSKDRYPGLENHRIWVYKQFGLEWIPHHVYKVSASFGDNGLLVTVDNPYLSEGQTQAKTTLSLPQFLQVFSRFDALQLF